MDAVIIVSLIVATTFTFTNFGRFFRGQRIGFWSVLIMSSAWVAFAWAQGWLV